jgi:chromosome partitioning protein
MGKIITVATSKGGAGKTTTAKLLLAAATSAGQQVAAIDADLNHSLTDWLERYQRYPATIRPELDESKIVPLVDELSNNHDLLIIDTAGAATQATVFAIGCADLVLIPCQLSSADVIEAVKTMRLVESAAAMSKQDIPARVVLTDYQPNTVIATHVETELQDCGLEVLPTKLNRLVAFKEMTFSGEVPDTGRAGELVSSLYRDVAALADIVYEHTLLAS